MQVFCLQYLVSAHRCAENIARWWMVEHQHWCKEDDGKRKLIISSFLRRSGCLSCHHRTMFSANHREDPKRCLLYHPYDPTEGNYNYRRWNFGFVPVSSTALGSSEAVSSSTNSDDGIYPSLLRGKKTLDGSVWATGVPDTALYTATRLAIKFITPSRSQSKRRDPM
jgi:hypothetical protein